MFERLRRYILNREKTIDEIRDELTQETEEAYFQKKWPLVETIKDGIC